MGVLNDSSKEGVTIDHKRPCRRKIMRPFIKVRSGIYVKFSPYGSENIYLTVQSLLYRSFKSENFKVLYAFWGFNYLLDATTAVGNIKILLLLVMQEGQTHLKFAASWKRRTIFGFVASNEVRINYSSFHPWQNNRTEVHYYYSRSISSTLPFHTAPPAGHKQFLQVIP